MGTTKKGVQEYLAQSDKAQQQKSPYAIRPIVVI